MKLVCLSSDAPCNKHNINVFNNLFAVPCNLLDEQTGNKTDFHNDLYHAKDSINESKTSNICISCQPFSLRSVKIQGPVPERPISANPGLRFCSTFCIYLAYTNILCKSLPCLRVRAQQYFVSLSYMLLARKPCLIFRLILG